MVDRIAGEAHGIRGAAATVSLESVAGLAEDVERAADHWRGEERDTHDELVLLGSRLRDLVATFATLRDDVGAGGLVRRPDEGDGPVVLHIEDNLSNLKLIERVLAQRPEIRLAEARTGAAGIALASELTPELILLDLRLPDLPGEEVLRLVRQVPSMRDTPIVVISAEARPAESDRLLAAGADDFVVKPIDVPTLLTVVDRLLERVRR